MVASLWTVELDVGACLVEVGALAPFGLANAVAQLAGPRNFADVFRGAAWRCCPHPARCVFFFAWTPVFPGQVLRHAVVVDDKFVLGVDRVFAVRERELEELGLGDRLGREASTQRSQ